MVQATACGAMLPGVNDAEPDRVGFGRGGCVEQHDDRMEEVLDLYAEIPDRRFPVVCFAETPRQLIGEARVPVMARPGKRARYDYEYVRNGTANVFMFLDVHRPWRHAKATERRSAADFADCMRDLVDRHFPKAELIRESSTTYQLTPRRRFTRPSRRKKLVASSAGSSSTTRRSTRVGSTWWRSRSA